MSRLPKTISVEKLDNSVLFTFAQNQHYLYDGTIEVPFNSLSIIADKSEAITLRKSASNDIFISAPWQNFDINASSKEDAVDVLTEMLYDEAGISEEEVQEMIDAATSGMPSSQVVEQLRTDVNTISGNVQTLSGEVATKADASDLQALSEKVDTKLDASAYTPTDLSEYWTSAETKSYVDGKVDDALDDYYDKDYVDAALADKLDASAYTPTDLSEYWTSAQTQSAIDAATSGIPSSQVIEQLRTDVNTISGDVENKQDALEYYSEAEYENGGGRGIINVSNGKTYNASVWADAGNTDGGTYARLYAKGDAGENALNVSPTGVTINDAKVLTENDINVSDIYNTIDEKEEVVASALTELNLRLNEDEEVTAAALNDLNDRIGSGGSSVTVDTSLDSGSTNPVANSAITSAIIDDEEVISRAINDLNDRLVAVESGGSSVTVDTSLDSGSTNPVANSAITNAINAKQDALSAGTGIEISGNVISTTGGGATYSAGTNISIDTANTINCTLPLRAAGSNNTSIKQSTNSSVASNVYLGAAFGSYNTIETGANNAFVSGYNVKATKNCEAGFGHFNNSVTGSTASGQTLFSVGNGQYHAEHNAFEIRENGDIYITSGNTDIKLQDHLGGGGGGVTVDTSLDSGSTNPVANSAITNALDAKADASTTYTKTEVNNLVNNKFWCGTQAQYDALATKENDVLYLIHE